MLAPGGGAAGPSAIAGFAGLGSGGAGAAGAGAATLDGGAPNAEAAGFGAPNAEAAGLAAPNADAAPGCGCAAGGFAKAEPAALAGGGMAAAFGGEILFAADGCASTAITLPSFAITKLVLHFGQRIFMPTAGMRRSSTSYGDLHDTHSTLIMDDRTVALRPRILRDSLHTTDCMRRRETQ